LRIYLLVQLDFAFLNSPSSSNISYLLSFRPDCHQQTVKTPQTRSAAMAEEPDGDRDASRTMSSENVIPARPTKPGNNKESFLYLDYKQQQQDDILRELRDQNKRHEEAQKAMDAKITELLDALKAPSTAPIPTDKSTLRQDHRFDRNAELRFAEPSSVGTGPNRVPVAPRRAAGAGGDPDDSDHPSDDERTPHSPRHPFDDARNRRERTAESQATSYLQPSGGDRIRRSELGQFDPHFEDPDDLGMVIDGKNTVFTDVYEFRQRLPRKIPDLTRGLKDRCYVCPSVWRAYIFLPRPHAGCSK
jgi:hypothetical protein